MNNTDNPTSDEEQPATVPTDYRALLAMTRPLVITEHTLPSWRGGEICRLGFAMPLEPRDRRAEFALRRGEILRSNAPTLGTAKDEEFPTTLEQAETSSVLQIEDAAMEARSALPHTDSDLELRIYLGMS